MWWVHLNNSIQSSSFNWLLNYCQFTSITHGIIATADIIWIIKIPPMVVQLIQIVISEPCTSINALHNVLYVCERLIALLLILHLKSEKKEEIKSNMVSSLVVCGGWNDSGVAQAINHSSLILYICAAL